MSFEENKNTLRDRFDSKKFEINEEAWNKLQPELDKLEKKKKRRVLFYFILSGLILSGLLFLLLQKSGDELSDKRISSKENNYKQPVTSTNTNSNSENETNSHVTGTQENEGNKTTTTSSETSEPTPITETKNPGSAANSNISDNESTVLDKKGDTQLTMTKGNKPFATGDKTENKNSITKINTKGKGEIDIHATKPTANSTDVKNNGSITQQNDSLQQEEEIASSTQKTDSASTFKPADSVAVQKTDTLPITPKDSLVKGKDSLDKKLPGLEIFASAYLVFTPGYGGTMPVKECLNPSAGIGIRKFFTPKFGIGTGLYYTIYGNISSAPKIFENVTQDFGYTNSITEIKQTKLHYIKLPLTFEFRSSKNYFSLGAEFMYLLTSASEVKNHDEAFGVTTETKTQKVYGYTSGFSNYDLNAVLAYTRRLTGRFFISALINIGFIDVKNNSYFNSAVFDRNKSLQVGIGYKLN